MTIGSGVAIGQGAVQLARGQGVQLWASVWGRAGDNEGRALWPSPGRAGAVPHAWPKPWDVDWVRAIVSHGQVQTDARSSGLCATQRGEVRAEAEAGPDGGGRRGPERRQLRGGIARAHTARWSQGHSQDWGRCNCTLHG